MMAADRRRKVGPFREQPTALSLYRRAAVLAVLLVVDIVVEKKLNFV
jgi:hypothetical protein